MGPATSSLIFLLRPFPLYLLLDFLISNKSVVQLGQLVLRSLPQLVRSRLHFAGDHLADLVAARSLQLAARSL